MKQKLKLNLAQGAGEVLTREELKHVLGGTGSGSSSYTCKCSITGRNNKTTTKDLTISPSSDSNCRQACHDECKRQLLSDGTGCLAWEYSYN